MSALDKVDLDDALVNVLKARASLRTAMTKAKGGPHEQEIRDALRGLDGPLARIQGLMTVTTGGVVYVAKGDAP